MSKREILAFLILLLGIFFLSGAFVWATLVGMPQQMVSAGAPVGHPVPWQLNFQLPASPVQHDLFALHNLLFLVNVGIVLVVLTLLLFTTLRFRANRNPVPRGPSHSIALEVAWTILPVLILIAIAVPSFQALGRVMKTPHAELTVKVAGRQWFWDYEYPDHNVRFSSLPLKPEELPPARRDLYLLAVDNPLVLPVGTVIRFLITSGDVNHAWPVPSLGIKRDAIPGRLNEAWTRIDREGTYYGQCSELCGTGHAYMPIEIRAVSREAFQTFLASQQPAPAQETAQ